MAGFFGALQRLFTPRVISVVLLLITFCLMPTVLRLVTETKGGVPVGANLLFALALALSMMTLHRLLRGIGRSLLIVSAMFAASSVHFLIFPGSFDGDALRDAAPVAAFSTNLTTSFSFDPGLILSFIVCYIALAINDLGSIQSLNAIAAPPDTAKRIDRGVLVTGLANIASGLLGVISQVNYSLSLGVALDAHPRGDLPAGDRFFPSGHRLDGKRPSSRRRGDPYLCPLDAGGGGAHGPLRGRWKA